MKAHIASEPRCLLLWQFDPAAPGYEALCRVAAESKLTIRLLAAPDLDATVGSLCGLAAHATDEGQSFAAPTAAAPAPAPAMIISGLSHQNGDLNRFITAAKGTGATAAGALKAMVTPTSRYWRLRHLLAELAAERDALAAPQEEKA
ncbi:MAG: DUF3783 domain-containing protein [Gemmiger sp.]|nr:DUF3783 domain-containing protein [Gemmiger sp.]